MSYVRLNIIDKNRTISGDIYGAEGDAVVAALTAEPETIEELALAMARFSKRSHDSPPFAWFHKGEDFEPYDAGILVVDLAARVVAVESTYSLPSRKGEVYYHNGTERTDIPLRYELSDDWHFVRSIPEYEGVSRRRREERAALPPLDAREVLYGKIAEFVAAECLAARGSTDQELFADIHAKWLMTVREDLRGKTPREILFEKRDFIESDLHSRELQWTFTGECPPPLPITSNSFRFAGVGVNEWVIYYDLIRFLLEECWRRVEVETDFSIADEAERLTRLKDEWLETPNRDFFGKSPLEVIERERRRLPFAVSGKEAMVDDDCSVCQMMAEDDSPMFWHLDGCNMNDRFEFSWHHTLAEYEAEKAKWEEFNQNWKQNEDNFFDDEIYISDEEETLN